MKAWNVPKIWNNGDVWILGGGPSIIEQFEIPQEVVNDVITKRQPLSAYSIFMQPIHKKHVIGINVAYQIGTWIDMVFFGDPGFFEAHKNELVNFPNLCVTSVTEIEKFEWLKFVNRDPSKPFGISEHPATISWNKNSGASAISIAVHAGAKRIFLLGFDMQLDTKNTQHWHSVYNEGGRPKDMGKLPFARHLEGFPAIAVDAKRKGIEIINVSPKSAITVFPKMSLKQALTI